MIVVDFSAEKLKALFDQVQYIGSSENPYALETHVPVFICKGAKFGTLAALWPRLKLWD